MSAANTNLLELIPTLTQQQQDLVQRFIQQLKEEEGSRTITFEEAYKEFVDNHRELLRLLSQ